LACAPQWLQELAFPHVEDAHGYPLRSRVRRFESCWGGFFEYLIDRHRHYGNLLTCENANKIKFVRVHARPRSVSRSHVRWSARLE
jgi:hypothetical protein